jgi:hypothetical protein
MTPKELFQTPSDYGRVPDSESQIIRLNVLRISLVK